MTSVEEIVHHYQKSIEKAPNDEKRLLHCLNKLYKLPVTVQHLQETGIGRTVNSLRKFDGEVGAKAKALVTKWKEMVAAEESSENEAEESEKSEGDNNIHSDHDDVEPGTPYSSPHNAKPQIIEVTLKKAPDESHLSSNIHNYQYNMNEEKSSHRKEVKYKENISTDSENHNDRDLNDNGYKLKYQYLSSSSSKPSSHSKSHTTSHTKSSNGHQSSSSSYKDKPRDSDKHSHSSHKHEKSTSHSSSSKRKRDDSLSDKMSDTEENKLGNSDEKSKSSKKSKSDHKTSSSSNHHHHHSSSSKHREHSKSKEHGSSSNHHKSRHEKSRKDNNDEEHVKEKSTSSHHQNGESSNTKHSRELSPQQNDSKQNRSEKSRKEKRNKSAETESKTNDSNKTAKKQRVHESDDEKDGNGIDQSTGASFAEALGMLEPVSSKKTPKKKNQSPTQTKPDKSHSAPSSSSSTNSKSIKSASSSKPSSSKAYTPSPVPSTSSTPSLLAPTVKLKPLEAELSLDLVPTISNNYRPMPLNQTVMDCVFYNNKPQKKIMTDEEAFGASISSKTMRTKVYSGTKTCITVVPSLLELCIRILQKNIDALEYTGGVPFDILKPILDRASAEQLFNFEHYNPYLMEDSDVLWQGHCNRRFRGKKRLEMETWREMFIRCLEEQESKLASLTENIKKTQVQSIPMKQTKLAYIDSTAKAPRNIRNKQIQFGTDRKLITTPAARVASLSNVTSNIAQVGDSRLKVASGSRDLAQVQATSSKPRKAPLMAKAMQLMNRRFKR